jgi:hypothetical protein
MDNYKKKYLKYKIKYLELKNLSGSGKRKENDRDPQEERANKLAREQEAAREQHLYSQFLPQETESSIEQDIYNYNQFLAREAEAAREHYLYNQLLEARILREREQALNYQFLTPEAQEQIREYAREQQIVNSLNNAKNGDELLNIIENYVSDYIIEKYKSAFNKIFGRIYNKDLLYIIIKHNYKFIQFISDELKNDGNFILTCIQNNYNDWGWGCYISYDNFECDELKEFYEYMPKNLIDNEEFVLELLKIKGYFMIYLPDKYKNNKNMALIALKESGYIYNYLSKDLQEDKEIFITAYCHSEVDGIIIFNAPDKFSRDIKFIIELDKYKLENSDTILDDTMLSFIPRYVHPLNNIYFNNKENVKLILEYNYNFFKYISDELKEDKDIIIFALNNGVPFYEIPEKLKEDKDVVITALKINGLLLKLIPEKFKKNKEVVQVAIQQNILALYYASIEIKNDESFNTQYMSKDDYEKIINLNFNSLCRSYECSICAYNIDQVSDSKTCPDCKQCFHIHCINEWLRVSPNIDCPMCKSIVWTIYKELEL